MRYFESIPYLLCIGQYIRSSLFQDRFLASKGHVIGQADRIKQLVLILVGNALKYTPPSGCVTITTTDLEHEVELRVEDTGIGVGEQELERVFERFYRTGVARNKFTDGTGLGLPIARSIVEAHGGAIWMESVINQGSRVIVRLPRTPDVALLSEKSCR
jgi:signal transduction histidine kinase